MEAGVRLDLGGGTEMAQPAPLRLGVKHKRLERNLDPGREVKAEPGVQWLSGCPGRQEPGWRTSSSWERGDITSTKYKYGTEKPWSLTRQNVAATLFQ